jgi:hypothetical protein
LLSQPNSYQLSWREKTVEMEQLAPDADDSDDGYDTNPTENDPDWSIIMY